ncbi:acyl-CoA dehydrogenase, partial [Roseburia hominis]|nr:acyl-CoA dehydrogenase [Roseburia hominis]
ENVLSPLNQSGDEEGCHFENGEVKTPKGFKEAYDQFVQGGWQGLSYPGEFGGQGLPMSLNLIKSEMMVFI